MRSLADYNDEPPASAIFKTPGRVFDLAIPTPWSAARDRKRPIKRGLEFCQEQGNELDEKKPSALSRARLTALKRLGRALMNTHPMFGPREKALPACPCATLDQADKRNGRLTGC